jgi:hypothetical protein
VTALGEVAVAWGVDPPFHAMGLEIDLAQEAPDRVRGDALDDLALDPQGQASVGGNVAPTSD